MSHTNHRRKKYKTPARPGIRIAQTDSKSTKPVALSRLVPGTVVYARIPYRDGTGEKVRPAVVIRKEGQKIFVTTTSSGLRGPEIIEHAGTGLSRRSHLRLDLVEVARVDVLDIIGEVSSDDWARIVLAFPS